MWCNVRIGLWCNMQRAEWAMMQRAEWAEYFRWCNVRNGLNISHDATCGSDWIFSHGATCGSDWIFSHDATRGLDWIFSLGAKVVPCCNLWIGQNILHDEECGMGWILLGGPHCYVVACATCGLNWISGLMQIGWLNNFTRWACSFGPSLLSVVMVCHADSAAYSA